jgi:hypothetical protein
VKKKSKEKLERHKVRFSVLYVEHPFGSFMFVFDFVLSMNKMNIF